MYDQGIFLLITVFIPVQIRKRRFGFGIRSNKNKGFLVFDFGFQITSFKYFKVFLFEDRGELSYTPQPMQFAALEYV